MKKGYDIRIIPESVFYDMVSLRSKPIKPEYEDTAEPDDTIIYAPDVQTKEEETYHLVENRIKSVIEQNFISVSNLYFRPYDGYWSITYASVLIARIHFGTRIRYFSVDALAAKELLDQAGILYDIKASDESFARILIQEPEDILPCLDIIATVTQCALDTIPKDFDCCSRVEACSDAKRCLQPSDELRLGCGYRKILASGRIFYGENRNID